MKNERKEIADAIIKIIQQRGKESIKNPNVFCAILDDMIPHLQKERKIIRKILVGNEALCLELYNMCNSKQKIKEQEIAKLLYRLKSEHGISDEWCEFFVEVFSDVFGWEISNGDLAKILNQAIGKEKNNVESDMQVETQTGSTKKKKVKKKRKFPKIVIVIVMLILAKSCFGGNSENEEMESTSTLPPVQTSQSTEKNSEEENTSASEEQDIETESEVVNSEEQIPLVDEIKVEKLVTNSVSLEEIESLSLDISKITIEQWNGAIVEKEQSDKYSFVPERTGTYRFEFMDLSEGYSYRINVYNAVGDRIEGGVYGNKDGLTAVLNGQEEYVISVEQYSDYMGNYSLNIGKQKEKVDVTGSTVINDSIQFKTQVNEYNFVPSITGRYRFELSDIPEGYSYKIYMFNAGGERIDGGTYGKGQGITVNLTAGQTYTVSVGQNSDYLGNYTLNIGKQKEVIDITEYTVVNDSFQFKTQTNQYMFTANIGGVYRFEFSDIPEGYVYDMYIYNAGGERIDSGSYSNKEGITVELGSGQTYTVVAGQKYDYMGSYTLNIGKQKETIDISEYVFVNDSIEFNSQKNNYTFTPINDGTYSFIFSDVLEGYDYEICVYNAGGSRIDYRTCGNQEGLNVQLTAGQIYTITVRYYNSLGDYVLNIGQVEEQ